MGQRGDGLVEVVLVEDDEDDSEGIERASGPSPGSRFGAWWSSRPPRLRSGVARLGATVAAVACVAVVVQQGTVAAEEAALAALPGRSVSLAAPLDEVWHLDDVYPLGWVDGDLLVTGYSAPSTRRIDPTTGAARWSTASGVGCTTMDDLGRGPFADVGLPQLDGSSLVCLSMGDPSSGGGSGLGLGIVLLDAASGTTSSGSHLDGAPFGLLPVDRDVVVATATTDGRVRAERWSPESGQVIWSYEGTEPVIDPQNGYGLSAGPGYLQVEGSPTLLLDLATGRELASPVDATSSEEAGRSATSESTLADGSVVRGRFGDSGKLQRTAADGTALPPFPGWPMAAGVDDGSGAGTAFALTSGGNVSAVDLSTGATRWTVPGYDVVAVLEGLAVVLDQTSLSAHDVGTGAEVWKEPISQDQYGGAAVTDGRSVGYLTVPEPGATPTGSALVLRVVDLRTGVRRAQSSVVGYGARLLGTAPDGAILVLTVGGRLSVLRPE